MLYKRCGCASLPALATERRVIDPVHSTPPRHPRLYRQRRTSTSRALATLALLLGLGAAGCASSPERDTPKQERLTKLSTMDRLYLSIEQEVHARRWPVASASKRFRVVTTGFEQQSARLRKQRIIRIVVLPRGGALKVSVLVERDVGPDGQPEWIPVEDPATRKAARAEEIELGRAIERRFHAMR